MKIVVVSPHLEDAAFSLSLGIEQWLGRGWTVEVINCFTRSEDAPFFDLASVHENDRRTYVSGLRAKEDESWRKRLGAGRGKDLRVVNLNLKDAPMRLRCSAEEAVTVAPNAESDAKSWAKIVRAVDEACAGAETALVLPLGLGGHVDHRTALEAVLPWVKAHAGRAVGFYEDLPYALRLSEEEIAGVVDGLGLELQGVMVGGGEDGAVERKRKMVLSYDSQIEDGTAAEMAGRFGGREKVWGVKGFLVE